MKKILFSIPRDRFFVYRTDEGSFLWEGGYQGMKVIAALPIEGESRCLILLDWMSSKQPTFENFLCVDPDGNVVWKAELPRSHDAFVDFQMTHDGLYANSWSCYYVKLDLGTGRIIDKRFVK